MIRFISFLLGKPYEPCKSCETLKQQLEFVNSEKKELTETLLKIISPKTVEAAPVELQPINLTSGSFTRRRAILEQKDREKAQLLAKGDFIGKPDNLIKNNEIERLERELEIPSEKEG